MPTSEISWPLRCIVAGCVVFGLLNVGVAITLAVSSPDVAAEVKRQKPAQQGVKGGVKILEPAVKNQQGALGRQGQQEKEGPFVQLQRLIVLVLCCCCCILQLNAEPINESIGNITQNGLYVAALAMLALGICTFAIGWGLYQRQPWSRVTVVFLFGWIHLGQGLMVLIASIPIAIQMSPEYAVGIGLPGAAASGFWLFSLYYLTQADSRALFRVRAPRKSEYEFE